MVCHLIILLISAGSGESLPHTETELQPSPNTDLATDAKFNFSALTNVDLTRCSSLYISSFTFSLNTYLVKTTLRIISANFSSSSELLYDAHSSPSKAHVHVRGTLDLRS